MADIVYSEDEEKSNRPLIDYERADNGLVYRLRWIDGLSGYVRTLIFDLEYYQYYLKENGIEAGPPLDKTGWPKEPSIEKFEGWQGTGIGKMYRSETYFARASRTGRIKIGRSANIPQRMNSLSWEQGERINVIATVRTGFFEERYHEAFCQHCIEGEWFAPHPDILAEIERLNNAEK